MTITLNRKEVIKVLSNYAFEKFGSQIGAKNVEELVIEIDTAYNAIQKMTITKKEVPEPETTEEVS